MNLYLLRIFLLGYALLLFIPGIAVGKEYAFHQSYLVQYPKEITVDPSTSIDSSLFAPYEGTLNLGYLKDDRNVWIKLRLREIASTSLILALDRASIDTLSVFFYRRGKLVRHTLTGDRVPFENRYVQTAYLNVEIPAGVDQVICRVSNVGSSTFPAHIFDYVQYFASIDETNIMFFIYFGFVLFAIISNIFLFVWLRESIHLYYTLATIASALILAIEYGFGFRYLWPSFPILNHYIPAIYCVVVFVIFFNSKFLATKEKAPFFHKLYYIVYSLYAVCFVISVAGDFYHSIQISTVVGGFSVALLSLCASIYILIKYKIKDVRFIILAWSCYFGSFIVYIFALRDILPYNSITANSFLIGSGLELLFFFLAIVNKIDVLRSEKERILSEQNETLDTLVHQRTEELNKKTEEIVSQNELIEQQNQWLQNAKRHLEELVDEQTKNLVDANRDLLETNSRLEQFAYVSAHNLRGPVATIKGLIGIYNRNNNADPTNMFVIEKTEETINKLDSIIKDLAVVLECSNQGNSPHEEVNLLRILDECKANFKEEIETSGINISTNLTYASLVHSLPLYMYNIFYHLISNSLRYSSGKPELNIFCDIRENGFVLVFKDNGIGMDLEMIGDKLFKPFKRFHDERSGRGLGLYQIKAQVDALKGDITLKSIPDRGTEVVIFIPVKN